MIINIKGSNNLVIGIIKKASMLWNEYSQYMRVLTIYSTDNVKIIELKLSDEMAERLAASLSSLVDNPLDNNDDISKMVCIVEDIPVFNTIYRCSIGLSREGQYINMNILVKTFENSNNTIWIRLGVEDVVLLGALLIDYENITLVN